MKISLLVLSLIAASDSFARQTPLACPPQSGPVAIAAGETVSELDNRIWGLLQGTDSAYWFGSDGKGVYRWGGEGKALVRFTTEHGLAGNHIRGIQEDRAGNILVVSDPGGVSRFDGRGFTKLTALEPPKSEWTLGPDDLWFPGGTDTGSVYRWDGTSLHRLTFPTTAAGDAAPLPR